MYKLNIDTDMSIDFANRYSSIIKENECYNNISNIALDTYSDTLDSSNIDVAFGGVRVNGGSNAYAKHAFFILNNHVIDPTIALKELYEDIDYIIVERMSLKDYRSYLGKHLHTFPKDMEQKLHKATLELIQDNILLYG